MREPTSPVVIVGAGQTGVQVADSLRQKGFGGPITIIGEEADHPYQRPPLSKDFMNAAATNDTAALQLRPEGHFAKNNVDLLVHTRAIALNRSLQAVELDNGRRLPYSTLVLATGAEPRRLPVPGAELQGVYLFRTLADARSLRSQLDQARSVAIIGAGFIGLEFAAAARTRGLAVTVLETAHAPLQRALSAPMAEHLTEMHRQMGTQFRFGTTVSAIIGDGDHVTGVLDDQGTEHQADLVLIGIGVVPRAELARASGLTVTDGIVVNERLLTDDPAIFAAGDCAVFPDSCGSMRGIGSVQNATDQDGTWLLRSSAQSSLTVPCPGSGATRDHCVFRSPVSPHRAMMRSWSVTRTRIGSPSFGSATTT